VENLDKSKAVSEIIKNYLGVVAIFFGGIWALYNFHILRTAYTTELNISTKESNLISLDFDTTVNLLEQACEPLTGLEVIIKIQNKGSYPVLLDLTGGKASFELSKLGKGYDKDGHPNITKAYPGVPYNFHAANTWSEQTAVVVLPGITTELHYFVAVESSGYYMASFFSAIAKQSLDVMNKHTQGSNTEITKNLNVWSTQKYFSIPERKKSELCISK